MRRLTLPVVLLLATLGIGVLIEYSPVAVALAQAPTAVANAAVDLAGKFLMTREDNETVTGLKTFSRSTSAPFAVNSGAAKVANLNADTLDGLDGLLLLNIAECEGRLTLTTGAPVTNADVTAATTLYFSLYKGNQCSVYDGSTSWNTRAFTELSTSLAGLAADTNFDVFVYDNAGVLAIDTLTAWTNASTRATNLTTQNGIAVKTGATTRRYVGTIRTTGTVGQCEDSFAKRFVWNYNNRIPRPMRVLESTDNWSYTTAVFRQANGSTANQLAFVTGITEAQVDAHVTVSVQNSTGTPNVSVAIGQDSTTTPITGGLMGINTGASAAEFHIVTADVRYYPNAGYHFLTWLEYSAASGTTSWYGDGGVSYVQSGIIGSVLN